MKERKEICPNVDEIDIETPVAVYRFEARPSGLHAVERVSPKDTEFDENIEIKLVGSDENEVSFALLNAKDPIQSVTSYFRLTIKFYSVPFFGPKSTSIAKWMKILRV